VVLWIWPPSWSAKAPDSHLIEGEQSDKSTKRRRATIGDYKESLPGAFARGAPFYHKNSSSGLYKELTLFLHMFYGNSFDPVEFHNLPAKVLSPCQWQGRRVRCPYSRSTNWCYTILRGVVNSGLESLQHLFGRLLFPAKLRLCKHLIA
jgi:hypothetical protein